MAVVEKTCPLLLCPIESEPTPKIEDLSKRLENNDAKDEDKIAAIKEIIQCIINGLDMTRFNNASNKILFTFKKSSNEKIIANIF